MAHQEFSYQVLQAYRSQRSHGQFPKLALQGSSDPHTKLQMIMCLGFWTGLNPPLWFTLGLQVLTQKRWVTQATHLAIELIHECCLTWPSFFDGAVQGFGTVCVEIKNNHVESGVLEKGP